MRSRNVIIAQSGGPSSVINNTLRGIIDHCKQFPEIFNTIYGGWHGIEGVLKEQLINLSVQDPEEIRLLETTPAAGSIGTCRYKLRDQQEDDFNRIIDVFIAHNIGYFFYIGGNDSQHTALKVSELCKEKGLDVIAVGVPKTIDNDLGDNKFKLIDHTPGYGSVAKYWANMVRTVNEENAGSSPADPVIVLQAMGRRIGYIPAAARLADTDRQLPLQIYMAESGLSLEELADNVNDAIITEGRCIVVVSEGFEVGNTGETKDAFGHTDFGASKLSVQQTVVNYLNNKGLACKGTARGQIPGTDQRHSMVFASDVDLLEAYNVGIKAVEIAVSDGNGWMATILRKDTAQYEVFYDKVALEKMALSERTFPDKWITDNRIDVSNDFIDYALPLIGTKWVEIPLINGLPRFSRLKLIFADKLLKEYTPQAY